MQQQGRAGRVQDTGDRVRVGAVPGVHELQHPAAGGGDGEGRAVPGEGGGHVLHHGLRHCSSKQASAYF